MSILPKHASSGTTPSLALAHSAMATHSYWLCRAGGWKDDASHCGRPLQMARGHANVLYYLSSNHSCPETVVCSLWSSTMLGRVITFICRPTVLPFPSGKCRHFTFSFLTLSLLSGFVASEGTLYSSLACGVAYSLVLRSGVPVLKHTRLDWPPCTKFGTSCYAWSVLYSPRKTAVTVIVKVCSETGPF